MYQPPPPPTLSSLARAGLLWTGAQHAALAKPRGPRAEVLLRRRAAEGLRAVLPDGTPAAGRVEEVLLPREVLDGHRAAAPGEELPPWRILRCAHAPGREADAREALLRAVSLFPTWSPEDKWRETVETDGEGRPVALRLEPRTWAPGPRP